MAMERFHEAVHAALAENILGGRIPDGFVLGEAEVARFFGVGRTPARSALQRLAQDGLIRPLSGRGFAVGREARGVEPIRGTLEESGAIIPDYVARRLRHRNMRKHFYPEMEKAVAASLVYGSFQIVEQDVAAHYGVSRTVARELLTRLDRVGLVEQQSNGRWHAGPLSEEKIKHHYEIRMLLEPAALRSAAPDFPPSRITPMLARIEAARAHCNELEPDEAFALETDLHFDIVLSCTNPEMRRAIYRSQLPLITPHYSFQRARHANADREILEEHAEVIEAVRDGEVEHAARALLFHIQRGYSTTMERLSTHMGSGRGIVPAYMKERK